ncbi:MAG: diacylglycerol kinase family protein [Candidatus Omnitrophota bacterium]
MYKRTILQSFGLAFKGLQFVFKNERNMRVHCLVAIMALVVCFLLHVSEIELIFVVFAIALVMITEAANTAFELLLDFVHGDEFHPNVKLLKDIAAGGVFIAALNAFLIGVVVFVPKALDLIRVTDYMAS